MSKTFRYLIVFLLSFSLLTFLSPMSSVCAATIDDLKITAPSAILIEASSGEVLLEKNADGKMLIASVTKVMTLTLIMEALANKSVTLGDMVQTSEHASQMGGSQIWLEVGEEMSVDDLMKAIAIESSNDAAVAMAEYIAGSEEAFVSKMNQKAQELGMVNTKFYNCTGLPVGSGKEDNVSSARDVATMSKELLEHSDVHKWLTTWMDSVRDGKNVLTNTNKLLKSYTGADGVKTGYTDKAKYCLSATASRNNLRMIAVVLGADTSSNRFSDASKLLDFGFKSYASETIVKQGTKVGDIAIQRAKYSSISIYAKDDLTIVIKKGEPSTYDTKIALPDHIKAPVKSGDKIGELIAMKNNEIVGKTDVIVAEDVPRLSFIPLVFKSISTLFKESFSFN